MKNRAALSLALLASAACSLSAPAFAARPLTADERMALRCGAAFAVVATGQARGDAAMKQYPPMAQRGREYFVRLAAQLMDDAGMDEAGVRAAARAEAQVLARQRGVEGMMPFCLKMLDAQPGFAPR
ncbi:hypothetical protein H7F51_16975 [Novosphingobium flavum]|uniref:Uncharacterized protein n=1 Tax=Novosphingobium flavum TaxID=1778672 RepID=A0A7X1KNC5_9SPHN|nr:hypothetical protein [Novosphingobium flavum]MBC2667215.1 hypothetical protein [Novosphingobium flavum]